MTTIILYLDLNINSPEYNVNISKNLQRDRLNMDAMQQPSQIAALDDFLRAGYTIIFNTHIVYSLKRVDTDRAVFILHKSEG
jgi:hypothetical protein